MEGKGNEGWDGCKEEMKKCMLGRKEIVGLKESHRDKKRVCVCLCATETERKGKRVGTNRPLEG